MQSNWNIKYTETLKPGKNPVWFMSEGSKLAGNVFLPETWNGETLPTIVVVTPAGAVKEQTAGIYAQKLSAQSFLTLAFDHRSFGESEGFPRYREDPFLKSDDIKNAITFMSCLDEADDDRIGLVGICSGAGYASFAAAFDARVRAVATVSGIFDFTGWITGAGEKDFGEMLRRSATARKNYYLGCRAEYVDAWFGEAPERYEDKNKFWSQAHDYYREGGSRGGYIPTDGNYRDAQCIDNRYMLNANPSLKYLGERPLLAIRGSEAVTGPMSDEAISHAGPNGELFVVEGATHIDMYHVDQYVDPAVAKMTSLFRNSL